MLDTPATFIAMAGTAFLVASYAPTTLETRAPLAREAVPVVASPSGKGDRLQAPRPNPDRSTVSVVEVVGLTQATVVLRDRDGTILYRSDPLSNTTLVSKDAEIPVVTLKEAPQSPVVQRSPAGREPEMTREGGDQPPTADRKKRPFACESAVSPLARGAEQAPGRCLADASTHLRT